MKIYTGKGDTGHTGLLGGSRVPKHHRRSEAYGQVDELNSYVGLIADMHSDEPTVQFLRGIQDRLFTLGSHLAVEPGHEGRMVLPEVHQSDVDVLERAMDAMDAELPPLKQFVLPGGHPLVSHIHVARCIARRAERAICYLAEQDEVHSLIIPYMNRLSDYLFVLSRWSSAMLNAPEIPWNPKN